jgi:hypothetical protein
MKSTKLFAVISILFFWSCQQAKTPQNNEKLQLVLNTFFDGVRTKDTSKIKSVLTNDFILYGHGKALNYDGLAKLIKGFPNVKTEHKLDSFSIDIDNKIANMTYVDHYIVYDTAQRTTDYLTSTGLRNEQGIWKIRFMQAMERN